MKEKAKIILEQNIELLNSIHNIVEFFKKHKNLKIYENSFNLGNNESYEYFHLSFIRSKKYNDCLDFTINNHTHRKLVFEEVEYKEILKTLILVLINIYKLKDFENLKDNNPLNNVAQESLTAQDNTISNTAQDNTTQNKTALNAIKANSQEKKSFYVEK
ncbi:hypothetical protein [Campylobacter helveticus]|uniref:hypothetical protein n=1 Tax=Campylobacter helveticus TaxID=28898 RepID=UPI00214A3A6D|nr:hypothetical protein [Campylobacter helveticus]MCR2066436.1 hypothetical protein [Campylobacter helveticus]